MDLLPEEEDEDGPQPATTEEMLDKFEQALFLTGKSYHRSRQWERTDTLVETAERLRDLRCALQYVQREEAEARRECISEEGRRFQRLEWAESRALADWFERQHRARGSVAGLEADELHCREQLETDHDVEWGQLMVFEAYDAKEVRGRRPHPCPPEVRQAMERWDRVRTEALLRQGIQMEEQEAWNTVACSQCLELTYLEYHWALEEECHAQLEGLQAEESSGWRSLAMDHCRAYMALTSRG
eukprot:EG_transcript_17322